MNRNTKLAELLTKRNLALFFGATVISGGTIFGIYKLSTSDNSVHQVPSNSSPSKKESHTTSTSLDEIPLEMPRDKVSRKKDVATPKVQNKPLTESLGNEPKPVAKDPADSALSQSKTISENIQSSPNESQNGPSNREHQKSSNFTHGKKDSSIQKNDSVSPNLNEDHQSHSIPIPSVNPEISSSDPKCQNSISSSKTSIGNISEPKATEAILQPDPQHPGGRDVWQARPGNPPWRLRPL